jgi:hypothetical protein
MFLRSLVILVLASWAAQAQSDLASTIRKSGGQAFTNRSNGQITEINLNGQPTISPALLKRIGGIESLTDLSLEKTSVTDQGIHALAGLRQLEWLNLYQTPLSASAVAKIATLKSITDLPVGETGITDAGLKHLGTMTRLRYLGLRGNPITDPGISHLTALTNLTGLHLGETAITDAAIGHLTNFHRIRKLWLHDTAISDRGPPAWPAQRSPPIAHLSQQSDGRGLPQLATRIARLLHPLFSPGMKLPPMP